MQRRKGFTLIELLIVVAIIAILAAIAIPNFLEAQVRSKVSRAKADMRTVTTAIEAYFIDHNHYSPMTHTTGFQYGNDTTNGYLRFNLTTPIAYITSKERRDPFAFQDQSSSDVEFYSYHVPRYYLNYNSTSAYWTKVLESYYGEWRLCSYGPDRIYSNRAIGNGPDRMYDPTNGTVSAGNIWRSQMHPEVPEPPNEDSDIFY